MKTTKTIPSVQIGQLLIDKKYPKMYRVLTSEITYSDLLNKTRALELSYLIKEKNDGIVSSKL